MIWLLDRVQIFTEVFRGCILYNSSYEATWTIRSWDIKILVPMPCFRQFCYFSYFFSDFLLCFGFYGYFLSIFEFLFCFLVEVCFLAYLRFCKPPKETNLINNIFLERIKLYLEFTFALFRLSIICVLCLLLSLAFIFTCWY